MPSISLPGEIIREELERILGSLTFQTAEAQKKFLRYCVDQTLAGCGRELKEYSIGLEVFHRGPSFDPRTDSIVRTEARNLRLRLAKYYDGEGRQTPLRIELKKGSYVPSFHRSELDPESAAQPPAPPAESVPVSLPVPAIADAIQRPAPKVWTTASFREALAFVALIFLAGTIGYLLRASGHASANDARSVVVLPFINLSADKNDEFFSDGLTEELMQSLTRTPGLKVVARTSAFQFKGQPFDIRSIGKQLGVRNVIEGSVEKYGDRLRISVQLEDATNGYQLWAETYDRELKDALSLQREISEAVTNSLDAKLGSAGAALQPVSLKLDPSPDPEAHVDYLRGLYFWGQATTESLQMAVNSFQQAIAKDPNYALAYEGLADAYTSVPRYTKTSAREVIPKINEAASKALELDSSLGEPHIDLGMTASFVYDWATADREYQRGLSLEPHSTTAIRMFGFYLMRKGQPAQALEQAQRAFQLDPVSAFMTQVIAGDLYALRRYDDAIAEYNKCLVLDPNYGEAHRGLGMVYLQKHMYPQAVTELELARRLIGGDPWTTGQLGLAYAMTRDTAGAHRLLNTLLKENPPQSLAVAQIYIGLGDKDHAFAYLQKSIDEDSVNLRLPTDPIYDSLRGDPRFAALLRRMNL